MNVSFPNDWLSLKPGDFMYSNRPLWQLEKIGAELKECGMTVKFVPAPGGYMVQCVRVIKRKEREA